MAREAQFRRCHDAAHLGAVGARGRVGVGLGGRFRGLRVGTDPFAAGVGWHGLGHRQSSENRSPAARQRQDIGPPRQADRGQRARPLCARRSRPIGPPGGGTVRGGRARHRASLGGPPFGQGVEGRGNRRQGRPRNRHTPDCALQAHRFVLPARHNRGGCAGHRATVGMVRQGAGFGVQVPRLCERGWCLRAE